MPLTGLQNLLDPSDEDLVRCLHDTDHAHRAFTLLVKRHGDRFFKLAYRLVGNRSDADDIVQKCFIKLWKKPSLYNAERSTLFTTWFYKVVWHQAMDTKRANRFDPLPEEWMEGQYALTETKNSETALLAAEQFSALHQAMETLPSRQRQALILCFDHELSRQEAAKIMAISLKALDGLLDRGKQTLRAKFKGEE